jgi:ABC-type glycerol-3-phosphate transport system substrate-binding protein
MTQMNDAFLWPHLPDAPSNDWLKSLPSGSPTTSGRSPVRPWRTVNVATAMRAKLSPEKAWAAWKFIEYWCGEAGQKTGALTWTPARSGIRPPGLSAQWQQAYDWQNSLAPFAERREFAYAATRTAIQTAIANVCVNGANPKSELAAVDAAAKAARSAAGH